MAHTDHGDGDQHDVQINGDGDHHMTMGIPCYNCVNVILTILLLHVTMVNFLHVMLRVE
jgi:hypothetical protein